MEILDPFFRKLSKFPVDDFVSSSRVAWMLHFFYYSVVFHG